MMVPKKSLVLVGLALLCTSVASAQVTSKPGQGKQTYRRYDKPLRTVSLDLQSGEITRGPVVQNRGAATCSSFSNIDLGGFVGVDTGSCACEWIDAATKNACKSEWVTNFVFAYCSAALDPLSGGPGGACEIFFREGYVLNGNTQGTEIGRFCLTGLPANTNCSSFFGGFTCFFINVTFGDVPLCFRDGAIGYGFKFKDLGSDGTLAKTWSFLSCVQSCTGVGPDGQGMVDMVDQYCPPGSLLSTFSFGTTPFGGYFTSISMDLRELQPTGTSPTILVGHALNPVILADFNITTVPLTSPALNKLGREYEHSSTCPVVCDRGKVEIKLLQQTTIFGNCTARLCNGPKFAKFGTGGSSPPTSNITIPLPKFVGFACVPYCVQMKCIDCANGCTANDLIQSNAFTEVVDVPRKNVSNP